MNTNTIIKGYKLRAEAKVNSLVDTIIYSIARAYKVAESEGEAGYLATRNVLRSVVPTTSKNKLEFNQAGDAFFTLNNALRHLAKRLPERWRDVLETEDQEQIQKMAARLQDATTRHYLYIFVRQDMCAEQQAVQAAHATFVAGAHIRADFAGNNNRAKWFDPNSTHFVLIGVPDLSALLHAHNLSLNSGISTHAFHEEDLNDEMTAFTTGIVTQEKRSVFKDYGLLKFGDYNATSN